MAAVKVTKSKHKILLIIFAIVLLIPILFFTWAFIVLGGLKGNQAKNDTQPLISQIESIGGQKICDAGYNGYGIDEDGPEYSIYFKLPNNSKLTSNIQKYTTQLGYILENNNSSIPYGLKSGRGSEYFSSEKGNRNKMNVAIYRNMTVPLYCGKSFDGSKKYATNGDAVVYISLILPSVN